MVMGGQNKNGEPFDKEDWRNFEKDLNKGRRIRFISIKNLLILLVIVTIIYLLSASLFKKAITKNKDAGTSSLNAFNAKKTWISLYKSWGVKATPAKKIMPTKKKIAARNEK